MLRTAVTESGHGPQKLSDLARFEHGYPLGYAAIKSGDVVVIWGAKAAPEGEVAAGRAGQNIIAYEKQTPTEGGLVLLENGTIKRMTAEEFKAAPKAR
ncbi:MAG: hypothetical protein RMJ56_11480 [Gemmataceae bacterium]|nr:hypothetical protein [Gemmata sp.]MDW8198212.1 hypothetical protein [Gemmataceae bacterium]